MLIKQERLGLVLSFDPEQVQLLAKIPRLSEESEEYSIISKLFLEKTSVADGNPRRLYIQSEEWKNDWVGDKPSCWISFQILQNKNDCVLIVNMRSCDVKKLASDLSFAASLVVGRPHLQVPRMLFVIGSLHETS